MADQIKQLQEQNQKLTYQKRFRDQQLADAKKRLTDTSVSGRITGLMAEGNPYLQRAQQTAQAGMNSRGLMNSSLAQGAGTNAALQAALPIASQEAGQAHQYGMQGRDIVSRERMQSRDIGSRERMQGLDIASREEMQRRGIGSTEKIAGMNIRASLREKAGGAAQSYEAVYQNALANILNNPDMGAAAREQYVAQLGKIRDSNYALLEQLYGVNLDWNTPQNSRGSDPGTYVKGGRLYERQPGGDRDVGPAPA